MLHNYAVLQVSQQAALGMLKRQARDEKQQRERELGLRAPEQVIIDPAAKPFPYPPPLPLHVCILLVIHHTNQTGEAWD